MADFELIEFRAGNISVHVGSGGVLRMMDAVLRYYNHEDPSKLDDDEWAEHVQEVHWIRKKEAESTNTSK